MAATESMKLGTLDHDEWFEVVMGLECRIMDLDRRISDFIGRAETADVLAVERREAVAVAKAMKVSAERALLKMRSGSWSFK
jgi:hypothetical protein